MYAGWEHLLRTSLLHCCYLSQLQVRAKKKAFPFIRGNLAIVWTLEKAARKSISQFLRMVVFQLFGECHMAGSAAWSCGWRRRWQGFFLQQFCCRGECGDRREVRRWVLLEPSLGCPLLAPVLPTAPGSPHQSCTMAWNRIYLSAALFEAGIIFFKEYWMNSEIQTEWK